MARRRRRCPPRKRPSHPPVDRRLGGESTVAPVASRLPASRAVTRPRSRGHEPDVHTGGAAAELPHSAKAANTKSVWRSRQARRPGPPKNPFRQLTEPMVILVTFHALPSGCATVGVPGCARAGSRADGQTLAETGRKHSNWRHREASYDEGGRPRKSVGAVPGQAADDQALRSVSG
jgi:hypothetical protein